MATKNTNDTKERPILFSVAMVRAILEGRKTQTRRIVKPQPPHSCTYVINGARDHALCFGPKGECVPPTGKSTDHRLRCPFGGIGGRLWVREKFGIFRRDPKKVAYAADQDFHPLGASNPMRPSIHMPRWASRITLEITGVRVQRLNDISEEDARAEGVVNFALARYWDPGRQIEMGGYQHEFMRIWDSINGKRPGCAWKDNPWVWVIDFKRLSVISVSSVVKTGEAR